MPDFGFRVFAEDGAVRYDTTEAAPRIRHAENITATKTWSMPGFSAKRLAGRAELVVVSYGLFSDLKPGEIQYDGDNVTVVMTISGSGGIFRTVIFLEWG